MEYFEAVQEGRGRVNRAVAALQEVAVQCYPMLFLKLGVSDWTPVGAEMLHQVLPGKGSTAALVICDSEGNSKAMSSWVPAAKADELSKTLERKGIPAFSGEIKLPI
jgi:hypothetical protein